MTLAERLCASFGGIALFLVAGSGVLRLFPELRERHPAVRLGYAWLLGVSSVAGALFALDHLLGVPLTRLAILSVFAFCAALGFVARPRRRAADDDARSAAPAARTSTRIAVGAAVLVAAVLTLGLFAESVANGVRDWDGQMTWSAAARWIRADRTVDSPVLREERWYVDHPQYPPLLPLMQVLVQETFATDDDGRIPRPLYAVFFPAYLLVLFDAARRRAGRKAAALAVLMAALVPLNVFSDNGSSANTTLSDFPLAAFWGAGVLLLTEPTRAKSTGVAAGLLIGAAALSKNEGGPLAVVALVAGAVAALLRARELRQSLLRSLAPTALAALGVAACLALFASWRLGIVNRFDEFYLDQARSLPIVSATLERLPLLPGPMWREMVDAEAWANFWWCAPVLLLAGAGALRRRPARPLLLAIAGALAVYVVAYGITPWPGAELVHSTWGRFLQQLSLPFFVLLAMALRQALRAVNLPAVLRRPTARRGDA